MIKANWEIEEAVMLVDLYYSNKDTSSYKLRENVERLSSLLRKRAEILDMNIDDKFRNIEGIIMKLENLRYLDTNGMKGLSNYSKIDEEAFLLRKNKPEEFTKIIGEFCNKYAGCSEK